MTMANLARRNILQYSTLQTLHHPDFCVVLGTNDDSEPGAEKHTAIQHTTNTAAH